MNRRNKHLIFILLSIVAAVIILAVIFKPAEVQKKEVRREIKELPSNSVASSVPQTSPPPKAVAEKAAIKVDTKDTLLRSPQKSKPEIRGRLFILKLKQDLPAFSDAKIAEICKQLLESDKADPADFAIEFISSSNPKVKLAGLKMLEAICIQRPDSFRPNEFYKAFAKEGEAASPYLSRIMRNTDDDFIREWTCELWSDIYFHNSSSTDPRHQKLAEFKKREENIYNFLKEAVKDKEELDKIINRKGPLGNIIIQEWGNENRMPMKMIALISIFDLMNDDNRDACIPEAVKIIDTFNFNYDILGRVDGKPLDRPLLPEEVRLKKLTDAVLKDEFTDTYRWLKREDGGFTLKEIEMAVYEKDRPKMREMIRGLRKIVTDILKAKLLIGLGQNEIKLLRYFYQKTWKGRAFNWQNRMLILNNRSGRNARFFLSAKSENGKGVEFLIPGRSQFVWFLPEGEYHLKSSPTSDIGFIPKDIKIKDQNVTVDM